MAEEDREPFAAAYGKMCLNQSTSEEEDALLRRYSRKIYDVAEDALSRLQAGGVDVSGWAGKR